jgi:hypothetical protein
MTQYFISIGIVCIGIGIGLWPKLAIPETKEQTLRVTQHEYTDNQKRTSKQWNISYVDNPNHRFFDMNAMVNGKLTTIGAWDTVRGEALLFPEYREFFTSKSL